MKFDELIDAAIAEADDFVSALLAAELVQQAPTDVLDEWLHAYACRFVTLIIGERTRSVRTRARMDEPKRRFAAAVESDQPVTATAFDAHHVIDEMNTRRRVGDMTGADHKFVAAAYQQSGTTDLMLAAFHRQVSRLVGKKRTSEVMSVEQYLELERSISSKSKQAA